MWLRSGLALGPALAACLLAFVAAARSEECGGNPAPLGTSRIIEVNPSELHHVGRYASPLPLEDHEVVLTFDDGPMRGRTEAVLDALAHECVKATFFPVGSMVRAAPDLLQRVHAEGHSIGTHSYSHPHLSRLSFARAVRDIDKGLDAVSAVLGPQNVAPFFRAPYLQLTPSLDEYLYSRGLMVWGIDFHANDWSRLTPEQIVDRALHRLDHFGRGILLLHDIHRRTAEALPNLLHTFHERGYRVVHVVPVTGR